MLGINNLLDKVKDEIKEQPLIAMFDRDGTLVPINPDPNAAIVTLQTRNLIKALSSRKKTQVGVLSARSIKQLKIDFENTELIFAGNYGMEIILPNNSNFVLPVAKSSRPSLDMVKKRLIEEIPSNINYLLEDHGLTLCLHWQMTKLEHREMIHACVNHIKQTVSDIVFKTLPTSYEVWPPTKWTKGDALNKMCQMANINTNETLILYAGDSSADEAAFAWVNEKNGISIRIGKGDTCAQAQLEEPKDLENFIRQLIEML